MKYINKDDLVVYIQQPLLEASITNEEGTVDETILTAIESPVIDLVKSYIGTRYDSTVIFSDDEPIRNGVLVQIIAMITTYRVVRRNAARKVPEDYVNMYNDAIRLLEKVQKGSQYLDNIPPITGDDGTTSSLMYGNNTNKNFFV